jgi:hypothetical protein
MSSPGGSFAGDAAGPAPAPAERDGHGGVMVRCEGLVQVYGDPGEEITALRGVDLAVAEGDTLALLGRLGAGVRAGGAGSLLRPGKRGGGVRAASAT